MYFHFEPNVARMVM